MKPENEKLLAEFKDLYRGFFSSDPIIRVTKGGRININNAYSISPNDLGLIVGRIKAFGQEEAERFLTNKFIKEYEKSSNINQLHTNKKLDYDKVQEWRDKINQIHYSVYKIGTDK